MTVNDLAKALDFRPLAGQSGTGREAEGCYIGDLLSWAMGRAEHGDVWLTVMGNVNAIAVASLKEAACIVLVDGAELDEEARFRADEQGVAVFSTAESGYRTAVRLSELFRHAETVL